MSTVQSDRRLRSRKAPVSENEDVSENESEANLEISFKSAAGKRTSSTSEEGGDAETPLNSGDDLTLDMTEDGGDEIGLLNTEEVRVDVTRADERARTAMSATATAFTPVAPAALTLPAPTLAPSPPVDQNMLMFMFQQMQAQAAAAAEQARLDRIMFQEAMLAMKESAPAREPTLRIGKPPKFDLEKDSLTFSTWKEKWTYYIKNSGITGLTRFRRAETTRAELQLALSDATIRWLSHQDITPEQREDTDFIIKRLQEYIKGTTNPMVSVINTFKFRQAENDEPEHYINGLNERTKLCELTRLRDIEDWFKTTNVCLNIYSAEIRTKLLLEKDLTFSRAVEIFYAEHKAAKTAKEMAHTAANPFAAATSTYKTNTNTGNQNRQPGQNDGQNRGRSQSKGRNDGNAKSPSSGGHPQCNRCGKNNHKAEDCFAKKTTCAKCQKQGHYALMCGKGKKWTPRANRVEETDEPSLGTVRLAHTHSQIEPLDLIELTLTGASGKPIQVQALPDSGANITAISPETLKKSGSSIEEESVRQPESADGSSLKAMGSALFKVEFKGQIIETVVFIIKNLKSPILSLKMLKQFKLVPADFPHVQISAVSETPAEKFNTGHGPELDNLLNTYSVLFDGKCKVMKNGLYHIDVDPEAVPVNTGASRSIPDPYMPALKKEIESLLAQGIIEEVSGATPWLHPIVVVPKKNTTDIRMCVDLTKLNRYVRRPVNPQLTPWEVIRNIPKGTKHYAVFDALKGYHQVDLDEESRALTTFMTPFGRHRYCRLPFGLSSAGDVFTLKYGNAVDEAVEEMKKIIRANVSQAGVLDRPSAVSGLMMFRNTPRSPTNMSPAKMIFGQDMRDSLPMTKLNLKPDNRFDIEQRLREVREKKNENKKEGKKESELLRPGQKVFVQHPATKRWTNTATVVNFGKNDREYLVRDDETAKVQRRNRKFLRIQEVEPVAPPKQPVQVTQPLTNVEKVQSEPSATLAKPEAKNIRPNRQKKPIVRFVPNQNRYYEPEPEIKDNEPENED